MSAHRDRGLPVTIIRPSHTYDRQMLPTMGRWTDIARMRAGRPVVVHGDGTTQWTITHADDVAVAVTGSPRQPGRDRRGVHRHGRPRADVEPHLRVARGGRRRRRARPRACDERRDRPRSSRELGPTLLGDKAHSMVFDNAKVRALVPEFETTVTFDEGARGILEYFDASPEAQVVDADLDAVVRSDGRVRPGGGLRRPVSARLGRSHSQPPHSALHRNLIGTRAGCAL